MVEKQNLTINIVEAPMGAGKTTAAINYMRAHGGDEDIRFMFVTPYLEEVERVRRALPEMYFYEPQSAPTKTIDVRRLIQRNENIATTHRLLSLFDEETIELLNNRDYVLILDEAPSVFDEFDITPMDVDNILTKHAHKDKDGMLVWDDDGYRGRYDDIKTMAYRGALGLYSDDNYPFWIMPVPVFRSFVAVYVLTYMFDTQMQRYYYDMWGLDYHRMTVRGDTLDTYEFAEGVSELSPQAYADKIHILDKDRYLRIGCSSRMLVPNTTDTVLSKAWYARQQNTGLLEELRTHTESFFRNCSCTGTNENMWTTFSSYKNILKGKGYTKGFVPLNMRATNKYADKAAIAYLVNVFPNPIYANFLLAHGVELDNEAYATSSMVQFLFRSGVRNGKDIQVYMPSIRMRTLLERWLEGE